MIDPFWTPRLLPCPGQHLTDETVRHSTIFEAYDKRNMRKYAVICECGVRGPEGNDTYDATNRWNALPRHTVEALEDTSVLRRALNNEATMRETLARAQAEFERVGLELRAKKETIKAARRWIAYKIMSDMHSVGMGPMPCDPPPPWTDEQRKDLGLV